MNRGFNALTPLAPEDLVFCSLVGEEELSHLFGFRLVLCSPRQSLDFNALIGQSFSVEIGLPSGESRYLNGQCVHFAATGKSGRWYHYEALLRPWLWYATRRSDCKIFQHLTVPQIVKEVLSRYPYPIQDKLSAQYREWDYCVQYRESDFNFVSRLMEHEGIYYYFAHREGEHTLVLCDDIGAHAPFPGYATIPFNGPESRLMEEERLESWQIAHSVDSGAFVAQAYDFEKPFADLTTTRAIDRKHAQASYEVFDYPGGYTHPDDGEHYARMRIQEMHCEHEVALAAGPVRGAAPGCLFTLAYHPRADQNREYLITEVAYSLTANSYEAGGDAESESFQVRVQALPTTETYRPRRETPKPHTMGPETALVVGPRGEEIYTDQYGRVKVQFPWDRYGEKDENSSCWIRVASTWAGATYGAIHPPRIGQEVIVDYLGGDPDRPMITGRVYNAAQMPPRFSQVGHPHGSRALSGYISSELGGSRYNQWLADDTSGEISLKLQSEHAYSEVNLGYLSSARIDGKASARGEGAELRSDKMTAVRGGQGVLISAEAQARAAGAHLQRDALIGQLESTSALAGQAAELAKTHMAGETDTEEHVKLTERVKDWEKGSNTGGSASVNAAQPIVALSGPAGVVVGTPESTTVSSGKLLNLASSAHTQLSAGRSIRMRALEAISLFAYQLGITAIAGKGKVQIQAQDGPAELSAAKDVHIYSAGEHVLIEAPEILTLRVGGAQLTLNASGVTIETSGSFTVKAASFNFGGAANPQLSLPGMPHSALKTDEKFVLINPQNGEPVAKRRYRIELEDGGVIEGVSDAEGQTQLAQAASMQKASITIFPREK